MMGNLSICISANDNEKYHTFVVGRLHPIMCIEFSYIVYFGRFCFMHVL